MKLLSLKLENFMGVKAFDFAPLGHSVTVLGANDSGKSTLETAYWWLLTGKHAEQSTDFDVYPCLLYTSQPANASYPPLTYSLSDLEDVAIEGLAVGFTHWF